MSARFNPTPLGRVMWAYVALIGSVVIIVAVALHNV